jgi:hypothetical protein
VIFAYPLRAICRQITIKFVLALMELVFLFSPKKGGLKQVRFGVAGTALTIDTSNNVGIGTSSPSSKLSVGTASYAQATSVAQVNGTSQPTANSAGIFNIGCTDAAAADVGGSLGFTANGGINGYPAGQISCRRDSATSSVYSTYMAFTTSNSGRYCCRKNEYLMPLVTCWWGLQAILYQQNYLLVGQ